MGLILCTTKLWRNDFSVRFFLSLRLFLLLFLLPSDFILFPHRAQITSVSRVLCTSHRPKFSLLFARLHREPDQETRRTTHTQIQQKTHANKIEFREDSRDEHGTGTASSKCSRIYRRRESSNDIPESKCIQLTTTLNILHMFFHSLYVVISFVASHRVRSISPGASHSTRPHHSEARRCQCGTCGYAKSMWPEAGAATHTHSKPK